LPIIFIEKRPKIPAFAGRQAEGPLHAKILNKLIPQIENATLCSVAFLINKFVEINQKELKSIGLIPQISNS
jgi:hypothetical protein